MWHRHLANYDICLLVHQCWWPAWDDQSSQGDQWAVVCLCVSLSKIVPWYHPSTYIHYHLNLIDLNACLVTLTCRNTEYILPSLQLEHAFNLFFAHITQYSHDANWIIADLALVCCFVICIGDAAAPEKKKRIVYSQAQLIVLEREFAINQYPNQAKRKDIAKRINVTFEQCTTWFKNRRARKKEKINSIVYVLTHVM